MLHAPSVQEKADSEWASQGRGVHGALGQLAAAAGGNTPNGGGGRGGRQPNGGGGRGGDLLNSSGGQRREARRGLLAIWAVGAEGRSRQAEGAGRGQGAGSDRPYQQSSTSPGGMGSAGAALLAAVQVVSETEAVHGETGSLHAPHVGDAGAVQRANRPSACVKPSAVSQPASSDRRKAGTTPTRARQVLHTCCAADSMVEETNAWRQATEPRWSLRLLWTGLVLSPSPAGMPGNHTYFE